MKSLFIIANKVRMRGKEGIDNSGVIEYTYPDYTLKGGSSNADSDE